MRTKPTSNSQYGRADRNLCAGREGGLSMNCEGNGLGHKHEAYTWGKLARTYLWPEECPDPGDFPHHGWLNFSSKSLIREFIPSQSIIVELGVWRGQTTRFILDHILDSHIICVDYWQESTEHIAPVFVEQYRPMFPVIYELFLHDCWEWRERIVPLRMSSLDGLHTVADFEIKPHAVYVDAGHSFHSVYNDLSIASNLFPHAALLGDDWHWNGVREAVKAFAKLKRKTYKPFWGKRVWALRPVSTQ